MRRFTRPASGAIRLTEDVWELLCTHAETNGNSSPREALEQLVRQSIGTAQTVMLSCLEPSPSTDTSPAENPTPAIAPAHNAAAALDALLLD